MIGGKRCILSKLAIILPCRISSPIPMVFQTEQNGQPEKVENFHHSIAWHRLWNERCAIICERACMRACSLCLLVYSVCGLPVARVAADREIALACCNGRVARKYNRCISPKYLWQRAFMAYATLAGTHRQTWQRPTWNPVEHPRSTSRLPLININFIEKIVPNGSQRKFGADWLGGCHCRSLFRYFVGTIECITQFPLLHPSTMQI